jgi:hypothetical protein
MKILLVALILFSSSASQAADFFSQTYSARDARTEALPPGMSAQLLVKITNDRDHDLNKLSVAFDSNRNVTGMYIEINPDGASSIFKVEDNFIELRELESKEGAVLYESQGKKAIFVQGKLNRTNQEGKFAIRYLANGVSMRYESCDFNLRKNGEDWYVQNAYTNKKVSDLRIDTWTFGIKTIQGLCPEK